MFSTKNAIAAIAAAAAIVTGGVLGAPAAMSAATAPTVHAAPAVEQTVHAAPADGMKDAEPEGTVDAEDEKGIKDEKGTEGDASKSGEPTAESSVKPKSAASADAGSVPARVSGNASAPAATSDDSWTEEDDAAYEAAQEEVTARAIALSAETAERNSHTQKSDGGQSSASEPEPAPAPEPAPSDGEIPDAFDIPVEPGPIVL